MFGTVLSPAEFLGFTISFLVLLYVIHARKALLGVKYSYFTYGFFCIVASSFLTNLEEFVLEGLLNIVEHTLLAAAALFVAVGCRRLLLGIMDERSTKA